MMILETNDLNYSYMDGSPGVRDVNIEIKKGKKVAFVGHNGSGKSTLFLLLNGTLKPETGEVLFNGKPIKYNSRSLREIRKNIGIVFQNSDDQIFAPTVYQDIAFGPANLGFSKEKTERLVDGALEYVGLTHLREKPPHHLSGGQKKRVAIAGVISMEPEIIILDEPLSNLDPMGADEIMDLLNELNEAGKTILISTHDVDLAYRWADYVYFLSKGTIIGEGPPQKAFNEPELLKRAHMRQPVTLEIYHEMRRRGLAVGEKSPASVLELVGTLKPPELMWVDVTPGTKVGDSLNLGIMYGEFAEHSPYEAVNAEVVYIHDDGRAIVEMKRHGIKAGGIIIFDVEYYDPAGIRQLIKSADIEIVGAMGKKSKIIAENDGIYLNVTSSVIDKSILMALCGKRCLILTNGGMVDHAKSRIERYAHKSGIELNVSIIDGSNNLMEKGNIKEKYNVIT
ncbi:cobalt ABC transporter, ATPase subunit [Methanosalsum zhilinae DSM 4017]|uniref:ABC transporter ATP-binding protein n=1 Tax=Methanosalsum zhilinae (strain DSM 4017 / NBRC 107636 / OCM 62 / WeN5) TaxID=679901 RepID=F7XKQ6_METZD|nr:ATP-binding cassette domain-containing protein [Methanosalsum zhilinae]AEH61769.1 cobalt ABC transporter, ATPase subunit [Methanosalsum zhilinae DSM 4017]